MPRFHKREIAKLQLQTAVGIFLSGLDRSSVITLAGAASGLLDSLIKGTGKEPFVDYARRVHCAIVGHTPKRQSYSHHIDKRLGVIAHKHLGRDDPETVDLDLEKMAADALCRAVTDYTMLNGRGEPFVEAFLAWAWNNMDGAALMESYKAVPDRLKPKK